MNFDFLILGFISYFLGSIPFGLIVSKLRGIDIRLHGSKNIGATNVLRVLGKKWGIITFFLDALKGFIPSFFFPLFLISSQFDDIGVLFGVFSILGHTFSIFLNFKGGKGVATSAGMLAGIVPLAVLIGIISWTVCLSVFKYVSVSSIVASFVVLLVVLLDKSCSLILQILMISITILIILLHKENIKRLLNGTENKIMKEKNE